MGKAERLLFREWAAVWLAVGVMLVLVLALPSKKTMQGNLEQGFEGKGKKIEVRVFGAVERPGVYEVEVGTALKEVVKLAGWKKKADRRAVYGQKRLLSACEIEVPEKKDKKDRKKKRDSGKILSSCVLPRLAAQKNAPVLGLKHIGMEFWLCKNQLF